MGFREGFNKFLAGVAFTGAMGGAEEAKANPFTGIDAAAAASAEAENNEMQQHQENRELPPLDIQPTIAEFQELSIITEGGATFFENDEGRKVNVFDQLGTELALDEDGEYTIVIDGRSFSEDIHFVETTDGKFILTAGEYVVDGTSGTHERITREEQEERRNQTLDFVGDDTVASR